MLSVLKEKASSVVSFLGNFVRDENSQVTKVGVLQVASILAVLSVMALPQSAGASLPCDRCGNQPCDYSHCSYIGPCSYEPCQLYYMPCQLGTMYYVKVCEGDQVICNSYCTY